MVVQCIAVLEKSRDEYSEALSTLASDILGLKDNGLSSYSDALMKCPPSR